MLPAALRLASCLLSFFCLYRCVRLIALRVSFIAGKRSSFSAEDVLRDRTLCFIAFEAAGTVVAYATVFWLIVPCTLMAYVLSKRAPSKLDERRSQKLRSACDEQIDVMADIIAMGVRSGLSFDAALGLYCSKFDQELALGLRDARLQWTSGLASRDQALKDLSERIGSKALKRFVETSLQAIHYGAPLAAMLGRFSRDVRARRKNAIERQIAKAPIKLLVPMGTCILPAMLILVMGPVLLQFVQTGF